jgi:hypothetical protein
VALVGEEKDMVVCDRVRTLREEKKLPQGDVEKHNERKAIAA